MPQDLLPDVPFSGCTSNAKQLPGVQRLPACCIPVSTGTTTTRMSFTRGMSSKDLPVYGPSIFIFNFRGLEQWFIGHQTRLRVVPHPSSLQSLLPTHE